MKAKLKLNFDTILAVYSQLKKIDNIEPLSTSEKVFKSIGYDLLDKFEKKHNKVVRLTDIFSVKKTVDMTLKAHEMWALYQILNQFILTMTESHARLQVQNLMDKIHQKLT